MVKLCFPHVRLLAQAENLGYGAAANIGLRACFADTVLLLNSDTWLCEGSLPALSECLDHNPRCAIAGPQLVYPDGTPQLSCFPFPGTVRWLLDNDPVARVALHLPYLRRLLFRFAQPLVSSPVPWVLGAALAVRRAAFEQVDGFDSSFFMYYEEVDLCRRLGAAGWTTYFVPQAKIVHVGGASTSKYRSRMAVQHFRSTLCYYRRFHSGLSLAFWIGLMRLKMLFRLVRDEAALFFCRPEISPGLREDVKVWARLIVERGR
jgi:GT2 family glycosyltransferase